MEASKFAFAFSTPAPVEKVSTRNIEGTPIIRFKGGSVGGKCVLNPKASMLLNMAPGDYAAFADNSKVISAAAAAKHPAIMEWAAETGKAPNQFPVTVWVYKGYQEFDSDGQPVLIPIRVSKELKAELIKNGKVDSEGNVIPPTIEKFVGNKTATTSNSQAVGCTLAFSDAAQWIAMREDADQRTHVAYKLDTKPVEMTVNDGEKEVVVYAYQLIDRTIETMDGEDEDKAEIDEHVLTDVEDEYDSDEEAEE